MAIARQKNSRRQQTFSFSTWGGKRKNAGRKPKGARAGVPHRPRPALASRHPVHVTLRVVAGLPNLRSKTCIRTIEQVFVRTSQRPGFRLVHYSVQRNHLHLLCEAKNAASLSSGLRGFWKEGGSMLINIVLGAGITRGDSTPGPVGRPWGIAPPGLPQIRTASN